MYTPTFKKPCNFFVFLKKIDCYCVVQQLHTEMTTSCDSKALFRFCWGEWGGGGVFLVIFPRSIFHVIPP